MSWDSLKMKGEADQHDSINIICIQQLLWLEIVSNNLLVYNKTQKVCSYAVYCSYAVCSYAVYYCNVCQIGFLLLLYHLMHFKLQHEPESRYATQRILK